VYICIDYSLLFCMRMCRFVTVVYAYVLCFCLHTHTFISIVMYTYVLILFLKNTHISNLFDECVEEYFADPFRNIL